jgi:hypothetical protein
LLLEKKNIMLDRIIFSIISLLFGSLLAVILWLLYGLAFSRHYTTGIGYDLIPWLKYIGGSFAVIGFILKEKTADILGDIITIVYDAETKEPGWLSVIAIIGALVIVALLYVTVFKP